MFLFCVFEFIYDISVALSSFSCWFTVCVFSRRLTKWWEKQMSNRQMLKNSWKKLWARWDLTTPHQTRLFTCLLWGFLFLSSDRRPPGGGSGSEDSRALLPDLPGGWASLCGNRRRREDSLQEGPQQEQEHLLRHAGDSARPVGHAAHCTRVSGGKRCSRRRSAHAPRAFSLTADDETACSFWLAGGRSAVQRVQGMEGGADVRPKLQLSGENLPWGHLPLLDLQQERGTWRPPELLKALY